MIAALSALALLAGPPDFDPRSDDWNGMRYVSTTAEEAKVELTIVDTLDWTEIDRDDALVFVRPGPTVEAEELREFVLDGGHAVVALDRGGRSELLRAFGLKLVDEHVIHSDYYRDHPAFPRLEPPEVAAASEQHFLWYNVVDLVLNHPAAIAVDETVRGKGEASALIDFAEPGQSFAIEVSAGDGYVLFLSDASILINDMQRHAYGDKQFAANVLRFYCGGDDAEESCPVRIVIPSAVVSGRFAPTGGRRRGGVERQFMLAIEALNEQLAGLGDTIGQDHVLFAMSSALLLAILLGSTFLPWPTPLRRFPWQQAPVRRASAIDYRVQALMLLRSRSDFTQVAAMLADRFDRLLKGRVPDSEAALRCVETFNKVRAQQTEGPHPEMRMSAHEFERLWLDCEAVLGTIDEPGG